MAYPAYRKTPARAAALKRAQLASAAKRRGKGKGKLAAANRSNSRLKRGVKYAAIGAAVVGGAYAANRINKRVAVGRGNRKLSGMSHTVHGGGGAMPKFSANPTNHFAPKKRSGVGVVSRSAKQLQRNAGSFGVKMTRKQAGAAMAASAAHGTTGSHKRVIRGYAPKMTVKSTDHGRTNSVKRDPNARRLRIHAKVGARGAYNAGVSTGGARKAFVATRKGVSHRR